MRHRARVSHFGRKSGPRKALVRGLVNSLVEHGRIKTTLAKAKELRRHVERAVTLGKRGLDGEKTLHAQRLLLSRYPNQETVSSIMKNLAPRFQARAGGYTRILKLGMRPGDRAEMAYIQFVDYQPPVKTEAVAAETQGAESLTPVVKKQDKALVKAAAFRKKRLRKIQQDARRVARV